MNRRGAVLVVSGLGLAARMILAAQSHLNADEALHYLLAHQASLTAAYHASLTNAHPPLIYGLLYFWMRLGSSEWFLRLPSVLAGGILPWVVFKWIGEMFDDTAGLIGAVIAASLPSVVLLSAEVREYSLLLLFMVGALYYLERAFRTGSPRAMAGFAVCQLLAILTHYSALWFTLAAGVYALVRLLARELPRRAATVWITSQLLAAGMYAVFWVTHLSKIHGSAMEQDATEGWLRASYYAPGSLGIPAFVWRQTGALGAYLTGQKELGIIALLLLAAGATLLLIARGPIEASMRARSRATALLLVLPFLLASLAALAGVYPFGGSRHDVFVVPFVIAGVSYALARWTARRAWLGVAGVVVAMGICFVHARIPRRMVGVHADDRGAMETGIAGLRGAVPPGSLIFTDYETKVELGYYLGRDQITGFDPPSSGLLEDVYGGYRVVSSPVWMFDRTSFNSALATLAARERLSTGGQVWVTRLGWEPDPEAALAPQGAAKAHEGSDQVGSRIVVSRVAVGALGP